jgi:hypothetical protein
MVAHTGYLIYARPVTIDRNHIDQKLLKETGAIGLAEIEEMENETLGSDDLEVIE